MNDKTETINCESCLYAQEIPMTGPDGEIMIGKTQRVCKHSPPQIIVMQVSTPQGIGTSIRSMFPIVGPDMCCHQHEDDPENFDLISGDRLAN